MKKNVVMIFCFIGFIFLLFFSFGKMNFLKEDFLRSQSDYSEMLRIKASIKDKNISLKSDELLKEISNLIQQFNLKDKIVRIQPHGHDIEIVFRNISQEEAIDFVRSLDQIKRLGILHADLSMNASSDLDLSLKLRKYG
jgi:hypothetical protein